LFSDFVLPFQPVGPRTVPEDVAAGRPLAEQRVKRAIGGVIHFDIISSILMKSSRKTTFVQDCGRLK
jgi:hypothetical protein